MNNFFKRFSIIFLLTLLFSLPVFSQDWYLCLGSFKNEKNAQALVESLKYNGFDSIIDNYEKNSELYYRVLLAPGYSDRNIARSKIKEIEKNPVIKKLKISGIWICTASDKITASPAPQKPVDVTKDVVIEKEAEKPTPAAITPTEEVPVQTTDAKSVNTVSQTESKKAETKKSEEKKAKKTTEKAVKTETATESAKSTNTATKSEAPAKPDKDVLQEELPPIEEDEVYDSDMLSQAKKIEKEIAAKNVATSKTQVKETAETVAEKETESPVEAESLEAESSVAEEESSNKEAESSVTDSESTATEEENAEESKEAEKSEEPKEETAKENAEDLKEEEEKEEEEEEELPSITLEINNAATDSLKVNYAEDVAFSEEKPYTLFVRSYRDSKRAEYDKKRLEMLDSQPSVIKTYSEAKGFLFNLYAGAFETEEEAEELAKSLEKLGIENTEIQNYNLIYSSIKKYNDFVRNTAITAFNLENARIPDSLNADIQSCIKDFPLNSDYEIEEMIIYDVKNIIADELDDEWTQDLENYIYQKERVTAAVTSILKDPLFGNSLTVYVQKGKAFNTEEIKTETERKITIGIEDYHGFISEEDDIYTFTGINAENDLLIKIVADNLTDIQFNTYLTTVFAQNELYNNSSFKNSIASIAKANLEKGRKFETCLIGKIKEEDAREIYGDYAKTVSGNTWIWSYFSQDDEQIESISLNLIYDWLSEKYYDDFMNKQMELQISETNRPSFVPFVDSWYYKEASEQLIQLSAKVKSFFIVASAFEDPFTERDLVYFIEDTELLRH